MQPEKLAGGVYNVPQVSLLLPKVDCGLIPVCELPVIAMTGVEPVTLLWVHSSPGYCFYAAHCVERVQRRDQVLQ